MLFSAFEFTLTNRIIHLIWCDVVQSMQCIVLATQYEFEKYIFLHPQSHLVVGVLHFYTFQQNSVFSVFSVELSALRLLVQLREDEAALYSVVSSGSATPGLGHITRCPTRDACYPHLSAFYSWRKSKKQKLGQKAAWRTAFPAGERGRQERLQNNLKNWDNEKQTQEFILHPFGVGGRYFQ